MSSANQVVLAIFAHPDDDTLTCAGTLAKLKDGCYHVHVLTLTQGEHSKTPIVERRIKEARAVAELIGYSLSYECLPDGWLQSNADTIELIEGYVRDLDPRIVITHYPQSLGNGHQDHVAVASAVVNVARRTNRVDWILYAEPPVQSWGFVPNIFVDITAYMACKQRAIALHQSESDKPYMRPELVEARARWWALQNHPDDFNHNRFYESFSLIKGLIRDGLHEEEL